MFPTHAHHHTSSSSLALASAWSVASASLFTAPPGAQIPLSNLHGMTTLIRLLFLPRNRPARILTVENVEEFADCRR